MLHAKFHGNLSYDWFQRRRFLKDFTMYGNGGHLGHVTLIINIHIGSPIPKMLHIKFGFNWPSDFRGKNV